MTNSQNGAKTEANVMEIKDFIFKMNALEIDLLRTISRKVMDFKEETGYSPSSIDVELKDITTMEDREPGYMVTNVKCRFGFLETE